MDWLELAEKDLEQAQSALNEDDYEGSCFAAQQAAEKAVKALYELLGLPRTSSKVSKLLKDLPPPITPSEDVIYEAITLDKLSFSMIEEEDEESNISGDYFTRKDAEKAIKGARMILDFCRKHL